MLDEIVAHKKMMLESIDCKAEIDRLQESISQMPTPASFSQSLRIEHGVSIIAEIKRRSPSKGILNENINPTELAKVYESAGARAISVLTEDRYFGGSIEDLKMVKAASNLPVLRKDFIIDDYQIYESRAIGADAILLIARILSSDQLSHFCYLANELNLDAITEIHNLSELDKISSVCPNIVGINNRNLDNFKTDLSTFETIVEHIPYNALCIGESGVNTRDDILYLEKWGAEAALIGESLVTSDDPAAKISELRGAV